MKKKKMKVEPNEDALKIISGDEMFELGSTEYLNKDG